jgi:3-deoxy-D-manno-octulosonic-acid transferase
MAGAPIDKARLRDIGASALARYIRFVHRSSKLVTEPADLDSYLIRQHPVIMAMWHGQFLMLPKIKPVGIGVRIMVARHGDAEVIGATLERFGMELIRGAGAGRRQRDRGGARALREGLRSLEQGHALALTADVPPGPARVCGLGIVTLARLSGRPIVPAAAATTRYCALDTWSRFTINLPFGTLAMVAGRPITVPADADAAAMEATRLSVEQELNRVTARAYELAGANLERSLPSSHRRPPLTAADRPGWRLGSYRTLMRLATPAAPLVLKLRERRGKEDRSRRPERLGQASRPRPEGTLAWVHAASIGEANVALPLIEALRSARPELRFLLTTGTVTSASLAAGRLSPRDVHQYVPLDTPEFVDRFLDHWRPDLAVFTESEIWPNLILGCAKRHVRLALVNARMSNRSYRRWRRSGRLARSLFGRFDIVLAQTEKLVRWFEAVGARRVIDVGNLKIDAPPPPRDEAAFQLLRAGLGGRPLLVAASTHVGEERLVADAHKALARRLDGFCTIIAPRHPERGIAIAEELGALGLRTALRSAGALPGPNCDVYIADTVGELGTLYPLAPVAFLGKSLVEDGGGQNPIEAVRLGAAVVTGPAWSNFRDAYRAMLRHKGVTVVASAEELAAAVERLITDEVELARHRAGANAALASLSGALARTVEALLPLLPEDEGLRRAS